MTSIVNSIAENNELIERLKENIVKQTFTIPVEPKHTKIAL